MPTATMDDVSSPNSSTLSVFDGSAATDVPMHDSPDRPEIDHDTTAGHRPLLPATERSLSMSSAVSAASTASAASAASYDSASLSAASSTAAPLQQRKRRTKKTAAEKAELELFKSQNDKDTSDDHTNAAGKVIKRRAARACVSCRNRKVRCDVVETFPCGNCRWDKIDCVVQEGRRRRRGLFNAGATATNGREGAGPHEFQHHMDSGIGMNGINLNGVNGQFNTGFADPKTNASNASNASNSSGNTNTTNDTFFAAQRIGSNPLLLPKTNHHDHSHSHSHSHNHNHNGHSHSHNGHTTSAAEAPAAIASAPLNLAGFPLLPINGTLGDPQQQVAALLPGFIRPLPGKMAPEDIVYLHSKGAFTLPDITLQSALLHAYVEFVHPYMPLLELHPLLETIHHRDGKHGTVSLLLYHAVMFAAASFVPAKYLKAAGFSRRREARKSFFMKARALYDFDYETDRLTLVQALLLMTYWYETPDDQKDTWHWMGVAVSLAHTIGLHRDPRTTGEPLRRQRLRKLLWWCCFMRDRMIALGMRRPKRIRSEDADVPMLVPADFDRAVLPDAIDILPPECRLVRDVDMQAQLAELCVEKAKLCVLVGQMLQQQYTILPRRRESTSSTPATQTTNTMMLFPNRPVSDDGSGNGPSVVDKIDAKLRSWLLALPLSCRYAALTPADVQNGRSTIAVQRTLLHLVYHTTMSALHRPRIQPGAAGSPLLPIEQQEFSRARVRDAADCVTRMGGEMLRLRLEMYLPTAGVTVFLPAMFAHLLDIKGGVPRERRQQAVLGFLTCMRVMESLRETYAAAEIAKGFVESLLKKAGIDLAAVTLVDVNSGHNRMSMLDGSGTSTPVNGTSASLLQATANVGVPYTEDGIAHAVAMYAANTPRATTPPAEEVERSTETENETGQTDVSLNLPVEGNNNVPYLPVSMADAVKLLQANTTNNINTNTNGINPLTPMSADAVAAAMASANTTVDQIWGLTPQDSAVEDPFEWDAMANTNSGADMNGTTTAVAPPMALDPTGIKLDFDQWLDFPPEGMGSSTDHAFVGLFSSNFGNDMMNTEF